MMESLLVALPGLGCAAMMVGMMWLMSRGTKQQDGQPQDRASREPETESQLTELRAELERLRAEVRDRDPQDRI